MLRYGEPGVLVVSINSTQSTQILKYEPPQAKISCRYTVWRESREIWPEAVAPDLRHALYAKQKGDLDVSEQHFRRSVPPPGIHYVIDVKYQELSGHSLYYLLKSYEATPISKSLA